MSYRAGFDTPEQYIDLALEEFGRGFASKAEQKDAMSRLSRAYEFYRRERNDQLRAEIDYYPAGGEINEELYYQYCEATDAYPMELHHVRQAKHIDAGVFGDDLGPKVEYIMNLRAQFKDTEITPREKSAVQIMIEEERAAAKAVKDDGFRLDQWITTQAWDCVSVLGNPYYRVNWYKEGEGLVSFARICKFVAPRRQFWESKGKPNMSEWAYADIVDFYAEVAA
jgi:hypothetical protein